MKSYFWLKYDAASGKNKYKSGIKISADDRKLVEFYKAMALKKVGSKIKIPKRQYIGDHPTVRKSIEQIVSQRIEEAAITKLSKLKK